MKGLIKKDLLLIKSNAKIYVILFVIYGFMIFNDQMDISFILPLMCVALMLSTFSYDSYNKWDSYVIALPDGRKNSVKAKYIATLILIFITILIISIFTIVTSHNNKSMDINNILFMMLEITFATTLLQSVMYPVIYKFGIEKARIGIFVLVFGIVILLSIISKVFDFKPLLQYFAKLDNYLVFILPIVMIIVLYGSYKISEKIYQKKEY